MSSGELETDYLRKVAEHYAGGAFPSARGMEFGSWLNRAANALDATRRERDAVLRERDQLAEAIKREATDLLNADPAVVHDLRPIGTRLRRLADQYAPKESNDVTSL